MNCKKCPHHVRHGEIGPQNQILGFKNRCGLKMKGAEITECKHYPFKAGFDYINCEIYIQTFKSEGLRNDVVPTSDFQYSDQLQGNSITEMEYL